jgi:hypothetical protein
MRPRGKRPPSPRHPLAPERVGDTARVGAYPRCYWGGPRRAAEWYIFPKSGGAAGTEVIDVSFDDSKVVAVLDTNVMLDLVSVHDLARAAQAGDPQKHRSRGVRAGAALRLAILLNEFEASTFSPGMEALAIAERAVPPGGSGHEPAFIQVWLYFITDELLPDWQMGTLPGDGCEELRGNAMDDALVDLAKRRGCPLITNEGVSHSGALLAKKRIPRRAALLGVEVVTAADFCRGKLKRSAIEQFMIKFHRQGELFHKGEPDFRDAQKMVWRMYDFYCRLLNNTTELDEPC